MIVRFERGTFSSGFFPRGYFSAAARTHLAAGIRVDLERRARVIHGLVFDLTGQQLTTERFPHTPAPEEAQATYEVLRVNRNDGSFVVRMRRFWLWLDLASSSDDE